MEVKNILSVLDYVKLVDEIADGYFYSDGTYKPAVGRINIMWLYYKYCVTESELDEQVVSTNSNLDFVEILAANDDFCREFNNAMLGIDNQFDFGNAHTDAMEMVAQRLNPMNQAADSMTNAFANVLDRVSEVFTEENMAALFTMFKQISEGQALPEAVIQQYIKSGRVREIVDLLAEKDK